MKIERWFSAWMRGLKNAFFLSDALILVLILLLIVGVKVVVAQAPTPSDDDVNAVARELYCPVCENIPLDVCPTTACGQWRDLIRLKLSQGWSKEQIKQYFVAQYGDRVLAQPPRSGLNWLAYGLPPVIFLVGVYLVYRGMRGAIVRRPKPADTATAEPAPEAPTDPYLARVEEELSKREGDHA
jgi:cytochrome c-type biogenesis protein CcmH